MIQILQTEELDCPVCGEKHQTNLIGFPKTIMYNGNKLSGVEYYHSCPVRKEFFQTEMDINQTFVAERTVKKNYDAMVQQQQQFYGVHQF